MYLASGALFMTMETVAGEKPVARATSLMVTSPRLFCAFMPASRAYHPATAPEIANAKECAFNRLALNARRGLRCHDLAGSSFEPDVLLFRWNFERHLLAESGGFPDSVGDAQSQPDGSRDFSRRAQVPPD